MDFVRSYFDNAWSQASLPLCYVIGIRKVSEVALPAFLASANGSSDMARVLWSHADTVQHTAHPY